jgi:hypothetical protein
MTPLPSPPPDEDAAEKSADEVGYDLSFLDDTGRKRPKAKSQSAVRMSLSETALQRPIPIQEVVVKTLKLKSNSVRDRLSPVGDMMLSFDRSGVAEFPESRLETVQAHMRLRPGRFRLLEDEVPKKDPQAALDVARARLEAARAKPAPEPAPEPSPEPEPVKKKSVPEPEPAPEPETTPEPEPVKKSSRKRSSKKSEES